MEIQNDLGFLIQEDYSNICAHYQDFLTQLHGNLGHLSSQEMHGLPRQLDGDEMKGLQYLDLN
jgi:hypothetical protein